MTIDPDEHLGLILKVIRPFAEEHPWIDEGDFFQESYLGLRRCVRSFDPGRGLKFSTHAHHAMHWACVDLVHRGTVIRIPKMDVRPVRRPFSFCPIEPWMRRGDAHAAAEIDGGEAVAYWLRDLTPAQSDLVREHLFGGRTFREIADDAGLPVSTVASRYRAAITRLRRYAMHPGYRDLAHA